MSKHVSEWLNAYHDGELRSNRLHHVETHLAECELCQAELESLESLSDLLQEVPTPRFTPVERFASQVNLRLAHKQTAVSRRQILEISWWMIPVGLLAVWIFIGTSFFISDILSAANHLGLLRGISDWMAFGPSNDIYLSATLSQLGLLSGSRLSWAESTEAFTRMSLPLISLQISIALLYLSWVAIWWARHTRQQPGQLLEG
jgi:predicted anti-sigma-YlaC factor YlaD